MRWYPAACPVCGGDLHDDLDDKGWLACFSCARTFPVQDLRHLSGARSRTNVDVELWVRLAPTPTSGA